MSSKRPFAPEIINRIDNDLLKNRPGLWSARTHMVWYYCIIYFILLAVFSFLSQIDVRETSSIETWSILTSLISFVGFVFWLIYLLRFNVFKRYGTDGKWNGLKTYLIYFLTISPFVIASFIPSLVETKKANMTFTTNELAEDMNNINLLVNQLEKDSIPHKFSADTFIVGKNYSNIAEDVDYTESTGRRRGNERYYIDTIALSKKLMSTDSVVKINDSIYVFFEAPDYTYVMDYRVWSNATIKQFSSKDIYYKVFGNNLIDKNMIRDKLKALDRKYSTDLFYDYPYHSSYSYRERITFKYSLGEINRSIGAISTKKFRWDGRGVNIFLHIFYYIVLVLSVLVFAFRHCTARTYFLTLLVAVLLFVLSGIFVSVAQFDGRGGFGLLLFYYLLFGIIAFAGINSAIRTAIAGIGINLFLWLTAFVPLICVTLYYEILKFRRWEYSDEIRAKLFKNEDLHYLIAEAAGFILLLVLIEPVFKKLYRKWYSLPEQ